MKNSIKWLLPLCAASLTATQSFAQHHGDFNGDGLDDLVVGAPGYDDGQMTDAGAVYVFYQLNNGSTEVELLTQGKVYNRDAAMHDGFGSALTVGDFNNDGYDDLAVGIPYRDIGGVQDAGEVLVYFGWDYGLRPIKAVHDQNPEYGDRFGFSLAAGQFHWKTVNGDDLIVGIPFEDSDVPDSGAVQVFSHTNQAYFGASQLITQEWAPWPEVPAAETSEAHDRFGFSLTVGDFNGDQWDDLAIGMPFEDVGSVVDAGEVMVLYQFGTSFLTRKPWVQRLYNNAWSGIDAYDHYGWSLASGNMTGTGGDELAIGVPGEDLGRAYDAGEVEVRISYNQTQGNGLYLAYYWNQSSLNIPGIAEAGDQFGFSLAMGDFNDDGKSDLGIGVPFEDVGSIVNAGAVNVIFGFSSVGALLFTDEYHLGPEANDNYGYSITAARHDGLGNAGADLFIGVPNQDILMRTGTAYSAGNVEGRVNIAPGVPGITYELNQNSPHVPGAASSYDAFGMALSNQ
jgi:hypothetical protein